MQITVGQETVEMSGEISDIEITAEMLKAAFDVLERRRIAKVGIDAPGHESPTLKHIYRAMERARRAADQNETDNAVAAAVSRFDEMVDKYNDLLRYCMAIPLLVKVRRGMAEGRNVVELDQLYLDKLAQLVEEIRANL